MKTFGALLALLPLLLSTPAALACTQDLECGPDARCAKSYGEVLGVCIKAPLSDNATAQPQPYLALPGRNGHRPSSCLFDDDCGRGSRCVKTQANAPGMCVRQR